MENGCHWQPKRTLSSETAWLIATRERVVGNPLAVSEICKPYFKCNAQGVSFNILNGIWEDFWRRQNAISYQPEFFLVHEYLTPLYCVNFIGQMIFKSLKNRMKLTKHWLLIRVNFSCAWWASEHLANSKSCVSWSTECRFKQTLYLFVVMEYKLGPGHVLMFRLDRRSAITTHQITN